MRLCHSVRTALAASLVAGAPLTSPALVASVAATVARPVAPAQDQAPWIRDFKVAKSDLRSTGRNPYLVLEPGYTLWFENGKERVIKVVLSETKLVDGVRTRVVEERETNDGRLVEVSRNYFAISARTHDVFYFGEDVDIYKSGKVVSHEGAWRSGLKGAKFGLAMPGQPALKAAWYQELAPGIAMDRAQVVSITDAFSSPAGAFTNCVKTEETSALEAGAKEYKLYAPGIGQVSDGALVLVKFGKNIL